MLSVLVIPVHSFHIDGIQGAHRTAWADDRKDDTNDVTFQCVVAQIKHFNAVSLLCDETCEHFCVRREAVFGPRWIFAQIQRFDCHYIRLEECIEDLLSLCSSRNKST